MMTLGLGAVAVAFAIRDVVNAPEGEKVRVGTGHVVSFGAWTVAPVPMFFWNLVQMGSDTAEEDEEVVLTRAR